MAACARGKAELLERILKAGFLDGDEFVKSVFLGDVEFVKSVRFIPQNFSNDF